MDLEWNGMSMAWHELCGYMALCAPPDMELHDAWLAERMRECMGMMGDMGMMGQGMGMGMMGGMGAGIANDKKDMKNHQ